MDYNLYDEAPSGPGLKRARQAYSPGGVLSTTVQPGDSVLPTARARLRKLQEQQAALEGAPEDYSAFQEYARQQRETGDSAMLNALAAQFAGESFAPIQAHYLKRAAAASEPMKLGSVMVTPDGKLIRDPVAAKERQLGRLDKLINAERDDITAQDRFDLQRQDRADKAASDERYRRDMMDMRRDLAANRPVDNSKQWRGEDALRNDYEKLTKDLREEVGATGKIMQIVSATPPGQKPDAITQQSLVILLNKFLDPGSVVREGEFDRVVKAQGMLGQAQNLSDRILRGQPLDANTIQQINGLAQFYNQAAQTKMRTIAQQQMEIANRRGLNVENVISDPSMRAPAAAPAAGGAPDLAAAARAELERRKKGNKP